MNNKTTVRRHFLSALPGAWRTCLATLALLTFSVAGFAQETTSAIRGTVTAPDGSAVSGASITVIDSRTSSSRSTTTNQSGVFTAGGLRVGGPYQVKIDTPEYASQTVTDISLSLGDTHTFTVTLSPSQIEEIVVTAAQIGAVQVAIGPSASFSLDDLQNMPAINRDIRDIIRADPRVYIDTAFVGAIQCVGANPRFNSLTVDGVRMNDNFGLNSNGYPTQRMPFPFDAVQNVSVEMSPYDVQYGGFTACNVNAVTRSGTNEFGGRLWFDYTDDSMKGNSLEGDKIDQGSFDEKRYGFSFGGPILRDTLFFNFAYEKAETADTFDRCAGDQSCGRPVSGVTQAQLDRIRTIAETQYNFDPGAALLNLPNEDEKYMLRLDWNINDDHNAAFTYNYNDGFNTAQSDNDADEYEFSNHYYKRGAEFESWAIQVQSNWTDRFSTDFRISNNTLDNTQQSRDTSGFGEVQIETYADNDGDGSFDRALIYMGTDDSRQSNKLDYETKNFKLAGIYMAGDHIITAGYEREETDVFNLFLQHTIGEYRFDESNINLNGDPVGCDVTRPDGCIDQFADFSPDDIYFGNAAPSLDPNEAAALFSSAVNTVYLQDDWNLPNSDFKLVLGLRYDWYTSDSLPTANANFAARTGYSNRRNLDGESLLQPRLGFNWRMNDDWEFWGGAGLYSGGNPNVWLGNNYQNDGITQVQSRESDGGLATLNIDPTRNLTTEPLGLDGNGAPVFDAPQTMVDFVRTGTGNSGVNSLAQNFNIPSNWKFSLGGAWDFGMGRLGDDYRLQGDIIYSVSKDSAIIVDDTMVQVDTGPDGRPIYFPTDKSVPGCAADPLSNPAGCDRLFNGDYILDNVQGSDARSLSLSLMFSGAYDFGLDWSIGYAYTESSDVNPMTSSVAFSNYFNVAVADQNNPGRATSNYEIPNRFVFQVGYRAEWFGDYATRFNLRGSRNQGRPYSYAFDSQSMFVQGPFFNPDDDRSLLYMPTGPNDPNVSFAPGFDQDAFFAFAESRGLTKHGGGIGPRNDSYSPWTSRWDLRISQEIPGFGNQRGQAWIVMQNIGNMINDEWGVMYEQSFPRIQSIVDADLVDIAGTPDDASDDQYVFNEFFNRQFGRVANASLWTVRVGVSYGFGGTNGGGL